MREHGHEYGVDPEMVVAAGSSAGGHLASLAALTANDPVFQPGFEQADTSVIAAISLYGYYGSIDTKDASSSPLAYVGADAPPFFVAHGDQDTLVLVEDARRFVEQLRKVRRSGRVRGATWGAALVRPLPLDPLRDRHRCDRGVRQLGEVEEILRAVAGTPPDR